MTNSGSFKLLVSIMNVYISFERCNDYGAWDRQQEERRKHEDKMGSDSGQESWAKFYKCRQVVSFNGKSMLSHWKR